MGIGARISAVLDLDAGPFDRQLTAQEAKAMGWSNRMKNLGGGLFGAKSARDSASAFGFDEIIKAEQQLEAFRKQSAFARLSTGEKIASIESEIAVAKERVAAIDGVTAEKLQLQLQIEQQMLEIERLRAAAAAETAARIDAAIAAEEASRFGGGVDSGGAVRSGRASIGGENPGEIERTLHRKFGLGDALKGLLAGVGFASIGAIAEALVSPFKSAAESATTIADESERAASATARLVDMKRSDPDRLAFLKRDAASLNRKMVEATNEGNFGGISPEEAAQRKATLAADLAENAIAQAEVQKRIDDEAKKRAEELADLKAQAAEAQKKADYNRMSDEEKLSALETERASAALDTIDSRKTEIDRVKAQIKEQQILLEIETLEQRLAEKATREKEKQAELTKRIAEATERAAKAQQAAEKARAALANFDRTELSFSLSDASSGKRGGGAVTLAAGRIVSQEEQAQSYFDRAARLRYEARNLPGRFSPGSLPSEGDRIRAEADDYEAQATALRQSAREQRANLPGLSAADADPLAKLKEDLKSALDDSKNLNAIRDSLKSEAIQ